MRSPPTGDHAAAFWSAVAKPRRGGDTAFDGTPGERTSAGHRKRRHSRSTSRRFAPAQSAGDAAAFWTAVAKPRRGGDTAFDGTPSVGTSAGHRKRRHNRRTPRRSAPARPPGDAAAFWTAVAKPRRGGNTAFDGTPSERTSSGHRKRRHSRRSPRRLAPARSVGVAAAFWSAVAKPRRGGDTAFDGTPGERTSAGHSKRRHIRSTPGSLAISLLGEFINILLYPIVSPFPHCS